MIHRELHPLHHLGFIRSTPGWTLHAARHEKPFHLSWAASADTINHLTGKVAYLFPPAPKKMTSHTPGIAGLKRESDGSQRAIAGLLRKLTGALNRLVMGSKLGPSDGDPLQTKLAIPEPCSEC